LGTTISNFSFIDGGDIFNSSAIGAHSYSANALLLKG